MENRWILDDSADQPWWKAKREGLSGARPGAAEIPAGPQAVRLARTQRRYALASSLGALLDILLDDIRDRFSFDGLIAVAGCDGRGMGRGVGAARDDVDAFASAYIGTPGDVATDPEEMASPRATLRSWRSVVVVPAPTFGTSFTAAVAVEAEPAHPGLEEVRNALEIAAPFLARGAELHALRASVRGTETQRLLSRQALDALSDPVLVMDGDAKVLLSNERAADLLVPGPHDSSERRHVVQRNNLFFSAFRARSLLGRTTTPVSRELLLVDPSDGSDLVFEVLVLPLWASDNHSEDSVFVLRDVTALDQVTHELEALLARSVRAEEEARREFETLSAVIEHVGMAILVTDRESNVVLMNGEAERLLDVDPAGTGSPATLHTSRPNSVTIAGFANESLLQPRRRRHDRFTLVHPDDGREFPVLAMSTKILDDHGEPSTVVTVLRDLTREFENRQLTQELSRMSRKAEERVEAATRRLAARNTKLVKQRTELLQASRMKSEFLATMSHELRTPINAILGYNSLLRERLFGDLTERQQDSLQRMRSAAEHLLSIVNDILDLSRVEAGRLQLSSSEIDLLTFIPKICESVQPMIDQKGLTCETEVEPGTPVIQSDRTRLGQVIMNLLSNAVKFTESGSVTVRAGPGEDERVCIEVIDTGIGIAEEHLETIFEEFSQVDRLWKREHGGTGLGLPISKKLIELLGGNLSVSSTVGEGTTFTVGLPIVGPERRADLEHGEP